MDRETENIEFDLRLEEKEYISGLTRIILSSPVILIASAFLGLFFLFKLYEGITAEEGQGVTSILIVLVVFSAMVPFTLSRNFKKQYRQNNRLQEHLKYCFTKDKLFINAETYNCELELGRVLKFKETKELLLIYETRALAHLIPKRAMTTDQLDEIKKRIIFEKQL